MVAAVAVVAGVDVYYKLLLLKLSLYRNQQGLLKLLLLLLLLFNLLFMSDVVSLSGPLSGLGQETVGHGCCCCCCCWC
jgi:hypothetical protein